MLPALSCQSLYLVLNTETPCPYHLVSLPPVRESFLFGYCFCFWYFFFLFCKYNHVYSYSFVSKRYHITYTILCCACFFLSISTEDLPISVYRRISDSFLQVYSIPLSRCIIVIRAFCHFKTNTYAPKVILCMDVHCKILRWHLKAFAM